MEVGVRGFRDHLRSYLEAARSGAEIVITERGRPIARLSGVSGTTGLDRMIALGVVHLPSSPRAESKSLKLAKAKGSVAELVSKQRG